MPEPAGSETINPFTCLHVLSLYIRASMASNQQTMIAFVILLFFAGFGLCQLPPMFLGPGQAPYEVILSNVMEPKPVMRYVQDYPPVYNENPVYWNEPEGGGSTAGDEILALRRQVEELSQQAMHMNADRFRHAQEVHRLREQLKASMETTNFLQRGLMAHEMELMRLWQTMQARKNEPTPTSVDDSVVKELVSVMERLEKLVDNVVTGVKDMKTKMDTPEDTKT